jgi:cell division protein FtsL
VDAPPSPKPPAAPAKGWHATTAKPRLLNAQWRQVIEQRRDLDDELRRLSMREHEARR